MNRLKNYLSLIVFLTPLLFAACSKGEGSAAPAPTEPRVIVVGVNPDYPPMASTDEKTGEIKGFEVDLMNAIAEKGGFKIKWKSIPWKGIFGALDSHDIDAIMSSASITEERQKTYDFSDPYYTISQKLVVNKADAGKVKELKDMDDRDVGVQLNTTGEHMVATQFPTWRRHSYDNAPLGFADLKAGSIFGFMVDEPVADSFALADPKSADLFTSLPFQFSKENYGIVVRKGDAELLTKINAGLKAAKEASVDRDLKKTWIDVAPAK
ncbi:basic amino acid ABC transporter substrate-binding protein [soil metagenome]